MRARFLGPIADERDESRGTVDGETGKLKRSFEMLAGSSEIDDFRYN